MICRCSKHQSAATWQTHTHFRVSGPELSSTAVLVTRKCGSLPWHGAQKNVLWSLRGRPLGMRSRMWNFTL